MPMEQLKTGQWLRDSYGAQIFPGGGGPSVATGLLLRLGGTNEGYPQWPHPPQSRGLLNCRAPARQARRRPGEVGRRRRAPAPYHTLTVNDHSDANLSPLNITPSSRVLYAISLPLVVMAILGYKAYSNTFHRFRAHGS